MVPSLKESIQGHQRKGDVNIQDDVSTTQHSLFILFQMLLLFIVGDDTSDVCCETRTQGAGKVSYY